MSASSFLDGKITRKHLADSASMELATKKKPTKKKETCDTAMTKPTGFATRKPKCGGAKKGKRKSA